VPRAGLEKLHMLPVEVPAQRAGFRIEGLDPVRGSEFEFGQDRFAGRQLVGQHARILAPSCYDLVPTSAGRPAWKLQSNPAANSNNYAPSGAKLPMLS
jgi:hypothetical protein